MSDLFIEANIPGLEKLAKEKQKFTMIMPAGGGRGMALDMKMEIVTRPPVAVRGNRIVLAFSEPRKRKQRMLMPHLEQGVILVPGHINEGEPKVFLNEHSYMDGSFGVRRAVIGADRSIFLDSGDGGESLLNYFKENTVLHTLERGRHVINLHKPDDQRRGMQDGTPSDPEFADKLFEVLGDPVDLGVVPEMKAPAPPRKSVFTQKMLERLRKAQEKNDADAESKKTLKPLFKLFMPEGAATWLVFGIEENMDTLWVAADLGMGVVEYGTASLEELETTRTKTLRLHIERDLHWTPGDITLKEILSQQTLRPKVTS